MFRPGGQFVCNPVCLTAASTQKKIGKNLLYYNYLDIVHFMDTLLLLCIRMEITPAMPELLVSR